MGLAIAKQLTELMDGEIGVQSEPSKGSTFWFTAELEKQTGSARDVYPSPETLAGVRVLAVDDNATNRRILRLQLEAWKMKVETAANGEEALKMMREAASMENRTTWLSWMSRCQRWTAGCWPVPSKQTQPWKERCSSS